MGTCVGVSVCTERVTQICLTHQGRWPVGGCGQAKSGAGKYSPCRPCVRRFHVIYRSDLRHLPTPCDLRHLERHLRVMSDVQSLTEKHIYKSGLSTSFTRTTYVPALPTTALSTRATCVRYPQEQYMYVTHKSNICTLSTKANVRYIQERLT